MRFILKPFTESYQELKKYWGETKNRDSKVAKAQFMSLIYFNLIFLVGYALLTVATLVYLFSGIFIHPYAFLALIMMVPFIVLAALFRMKYYPKFKKHYLKNVQ
ncbi:hypothetical protein EQV77_06200 [Halobacillus fulvus]|nr:hypothetical protein EQV77_06200 [Halobacillus fulvus]